MTRQQRRSKLSGTASESSLRVRDHSLRLNVEWVSVGTLRPAARNARTHSKKQIRQLAAVIKQVGFLVPILTDKHGRIIAGHGRREAAILLGMSEVPVICVSHLTDAEIRALALADNRLAEKAGWDRELLAIEIKELSLLLPEIGLDISMTGFEPGEVDGLMLDFGNDRANPADEIPDVDRKAVVSRSGDLFILGQHRLYVGDARDEHAFTALMQTVRAAMAFLDPPYNVRIGSVGGRGSIKHREFMVASGEMTPRQFTEFLEEILGLCADYSVDGAIHYICMDWRHMEELLTAGKAVYTELKNLCVWVKNNAGQGSFYRSQHEFVFVFKVGDAPHINTFELGQGGRTRSNVWPYAGVNSFRAGRLDELKMHPTVKPQLLVVDAMRDCSKRGDVVLDVFAGSGTTIIAAEQIGRRAYCMEIDPAYADVCIRRWQAYTGKDAVLERSGQTFGDLAASRVRQGPPVSQDTTARLSSPLRRPSKPASAKKGLPSGASQASNKAALSDPQRPNRRSSR